MTVAKADVVVTFQDGSVTPTQAGGNGSNIYAGTTDIHLREVRPPNYNTGGEPILVLGEWGTNRSDDTRPIINFAYGSLGAYMQANNLKIKSATLSLYCNGVQNTSNPYQTVDVYAFTSAFNEGTGSIGTGDGRPAATGESCWNYQSYDSTPWSSSAGGDWAVPALDTGIALSSSTPGNWVNFNVTNAFAADGSNLGGQDGLLLLARCDSSNTYFNDTGNGQFYFNSREAATNHPMLQITLASVPEPSSLVLAACGLLVLAAYAWRRRK